MLEDSSGNNSSERGSIDLEKVITKPALGVIETSLWAVFAFLGPQFLVVPFAPVFGLLSRSENVRFFAEQVTAVVVTLAIIYFAGKINKVSWRNVGFNKISIKHLGFALMALPVYFFATIATTKISTLLFTVDLEQKQDLGFESPHGFEILLSFVFLVILTPIVEETVFRGFLFRAYRRRFGFVLGALLVSLLFGIAHGQLNVGLDVFALSLILCYLREKTKSIWPSIMLHGLKNLVAFIFVFIMGAK